MPVRVLIVDDHEAVRRGIRSLLARRADWIVCGEATDGLHATEMARSLRPDVILMDMSMPRMDGAEATRIIRREVPEAQVIIVTQNDPALVRQHAAQIGARGYVSKATLARDLLPAILNIIGENHVENGRVDTSAKSAHEQWLFGGGDLGHLIREHDWSDNPLRPIQNWSGSLKTAVNLMLNSQHPIWIGWGPEMTFLYNDAYISVLSLAKHPWSLGRPAREVWAEIWDVCGPLADKVFSKGEPSFMNEVRLFMNRGEYLEETYYSFSYSPIYDESGKVAGLFCPSMETTDKVLHARRLRTLSELSARALTERTSEAASAACIEIMSQNEDDIPFGMLYLIDKERQIATLRGATHLAGGVSGLSPLQIDLAGGTPESQLWHIRDVIEKVQPRVVSLPVLHSLLFGAASQPIADALVLPVSSPGQQTAIGVLIAGVNPTRKLDAEYRTFFTLCADQVGTAIQNARVLEEETRRADELAELDRAKTQFFSNISHEFRTPLTLMLAPLEDTLRDTGSLSATSRTRLEVAHRNSLRLLRLVNTLLDFSRIEAGRVQAAFEPVDLSTLTAELASMFQSATERAGLRLIVHCGQFSEPVYVDREMWEKIVLNLISNAFKFTFDGEIEVSLQPSHGFAKLSVRDTGTGIPAEELPHLFERFHRVKGAQARTYEGSGIGLSLVQELARLHGGSVSVESAVNRGSTFTVSIPLGKHRLPADHIVSSRRLNPAQMRGEVYVQEALRWLPGPDVSVGQEDTLRGSADGLPSSSASNSGYRSRILLADDNADMREYIQRLLAAQYDVETVPDGEAALQSARHRPPDLIVSDIMMPKLDGFALLHAVRSDDRLKTTPVILLSARAGDESRLEAIQSVADDYLVKPFSARELMARVKTHLELARVRKEAGDALRKSEERLLALVNASSYVLYRMNADWTEMQQLDSRGFLTDSKAGNMNWLQEYIHPDDQALVLKRIQEAIRTKSTFEMEHRVRRLDGTVGWTLSRAVPLFDPNGEITEWFGAASDVTSRKQAEERERQITAATIAATAKFRAVFEQTTQFAGIMTNDGMFVEANKLCLEVCGYRAEDVLGRFFWDTAWWKNSPESRRKIKEATPLAARGIPYREILDYSWSDGTERLLDFALYPILDDDGHVLFLHPTGVDITDIKRNEDNYRKLAETLELEVRARTWQLEDRNIEVLRQSELVREFSLRLLHAQDEERRRIARELHDSVGQTLTVLGISLGQLVVSVAPRAPEIMAEAEQLQEIVQQLHREIRTMSYLLHPPLLDENGLYSALSWYVEGLSERSDLSISLDIAEDFGRLSPDMELVVFRLVQEALTNIHRHSGSQSALIRLQREGDYISLSIEDRGRGMSPERLSQVQAGTSGLGIRGMRERLRQFAGKLTVDSDPTGTRIVVKIPLQTETSVAANTP